MTDANNKAIERYVIQDKDWKMMKSIEFYSRQYRAVEFKYPIHEQKMLVIVEYMKH